MKLSALYQRPPHRRESVFIFDEVQQCPPARQMIRRNACRKRCAQALRANGHELYYYCRADSQKQSQHHGKGFLVSGEKKIRPIEVKSGKYQRHASLDKLRGTFGSKLGQSYILYKEDIMVRENIAHLPLYLAMFL